MINVRRGNAALMLLAVGLALVLGCVGLFYLLTRSPGQPAPSPQAALASPPPKALATVPDPLPLVKERVGKGVSNGAKAELLGVWQGQPPTWVPESPGRVKLTLKKGEATWTIENGEARPDNALAEQLESWVPGKTGDLPPFLAESQPAAPAKVSPVEVAPAPAPAPAPAAQSQPRQSSGQNKPDTAWRDDGDPTRITNADLPAAAFSPKKPRPGKTPKQTTRAEMGSAGNLRLMGVMEDDQGKKAILNQGGQYVEVEVGESVGSYRVESIDGREVVLDKNGTRVRVSSDSAPPPRPAKPEPPPRPQMPDRPSMTIDQDLEVPPIEEPVFDPGPFDDAK